MEFIKSERIYLRPLLLSDARDLFSYRSDPEVFKFQSWKPHTLNEAENFIKTRIVGEPNLPGTWFQLAICKIDSSELIGDCGLHFLEKELDQVEIGITVKREHQGLGYATEVLTVIFQYVFDELKKQCIVASVDPNNQASIRLLERMKMRIETQSIDGVQLRGERRDDIEYAITAREWNKD